MYQSSSRLYSAKGIMVGMIDKTKGYVSDVIASMPKPETTVTGVSVKKLGRKYATFRCKVSVNNPYSHSLPICEVSFVLKSNGRVIASGTVPNRPGSLKANGITKLVVPVDVRYECLISLIRYIARDWHIDYQIDIGLTIDLPIIGKFTIPLSREGEIKLP